MSNEENKEVQKMNLDNQSTNVENNIYDVVYSDSSDNLKFNKKDKKEKQTEKKGKIVCMALAFSIFGSLLGGGLSYVALKSEIPIQQPTTNIIANPANFKNNDDALTITEAFNKVAPAVVVISAKGIKIVNGFFPTETDGIGTGFIINQDGYVLTNYHVVEGAQEVTLTLSDKREVKAKVVNFDQEQDVAMLKIAEDIEVPAVVELGDSEALQQGEDVIAIGTPMSADLSQTVTRGIVSAKNRDITTDTGVQLNLIQTDASINPGNSGGPLVNTKGQVVGINTLKMAGEVEGIGFAIPINDVKGKIESLSKPILNLGISIRTIDSELAKQLKLEEGLYIVEVMPFSPAEKGGLKNGDLITKVDGKRVKTFEELQKIKDEKSEGDILKVTYIRDGKEDTKEVILKSE